MPLIPQAWRQAVADYILGDGGLPKSAPPKPQDPEPTQSAEPATPHRSLSEVLLAAVPPEEWLEKALAKLEYEVHEPHPELWARIKAHIHQTPQSVEHLADTSQDQETIMATAAILTPEAAAQTVAQAQPSSEGQLPEHVHLMAVHAMKAIHLPAFITKFWDAFKKMWGKAPSYVQAATSAINYVAPFIEGLLAFFDPAAVVIVGAIVDKIKSALTAVDLVIKDAGPVPTIMTYLNAIKADIQQLLTAAQIKDPSLQEKFTAITTLIVNEIDAIVTAVSAPPVTA